MRSVFLGQTRCYTVTVITKYYRIVYLFTELLVFTFTRWLCPSDSVTLAVFCSYFVQAYFVKIIVIIINSNIINVQSDKKVTFLH